MEYGEIIFDNDHIVFELSRADRLAADGWRFRQRRGVALRTLIAAWAGAKGLVRKALRAGKLGISPAQRRVSY